MFTGYILVFKIIIWENDDKKLKGLLVLSVDECIGKRYLFILLVGAWIGMLKAYINFTF